MRQQLVMPVHNEKGFSLASDRLSHATINPITEDANLAKAHAAPTFNHDFSRVKVNGEQTAQPASACSFSPTRCPFGGACHACPVQTKLTIGQPNDKYEQEADRIADQVMSMPDPRVQRQDVPEEEEEEPNIQSKTIADQISPLVQRQGEPEEEEETVQPKLVGDPQLQRQEMEPENQDEEDGVMQAKQDKGQNRQVSPSLEAQIRSSQSGGQPLPESMRTFFEPRFGHNFSQVRVHADEKATRMAQAVNAKAFTLGQNIVFGSGQYSPSNNRGQRLMAHELVHTLQQKSSKNISPLSRVQRVRDWRTIYQECRANVFGNRTRLNWGGRRVPSQRTIDTILQVTDVGAGGYGPADLATVWAIESNFTTRPRNNQNSNGSVDIGPVQINYQAHSPSMSQRRRNAIFGTNLSGGQSFNGNLLANLRYGWRYLQRRGHGGYNPGSSRRMGVVNQLLPELRQLVTCMLNKRTITFTQPEIVSGP